MVTKKRGGKTKFSDMKIIIASIIVISLIVGGIIIFRNQGTMVNNVRDTTISGPGVGEIVDGDEIKTLLDGTKYIIHPSLILSGGPPKGGIGIDIGISAIVNPKFVSVEEANDFLDDNDIVFGMSLNGFVRAYTKEVLVFHEIVNDNFGDTPILVTYCPLCGTAIAFERTIDGESIRFGTSGKLHKSNLVMYDEKTDSYWTQIGGRAVVGPLTGTKLKQVQIDTMLYGDWKKLNPDSQILSRNTGFSRPYGIDPYGNYYSSKNIGFGVNFNDNRLHPKAMIAGVIIDEEIKAYPVIEVDKVGLVNDNVGNTGILVTKNPQIDINSGFEVNPLRVFDRNLDGKILEFELMDDKLFDIQTDSEWNFDGESIDGSNKGKKLNLIVRESDMWFSWLAFYPDTGLFLA